MRIQVYKSKSFGLEVYKIYVCGCMYAEFLSIELAMTKYNELCKQYQGLIK